MSANAQLPGYHHRSSVMSATSTTRRYAGIRTRHKAYAVREYGSCTFHYAHEFVRMPIPAHAHWPQGTFGSKVKHGQGMRRVLVPLALIGRSKEKNVPPERGFGHQPSVSHWQLDTDAGVHHMSDRVVNGPRKGVEQFGARFREWNVMRCGK
jgi:hypothetical protein